MLKISLKPVSEEKVQKIAQVLMNTEDEYEVLKLIDKMITPFQIDVHRNDSRYDNTPNYMYDLKIIHDLFPDLLMPFCLATAKTHFSDRSADRVINHYVTDRYNFINENREIKKDFAYYLAERGITEDQYYVEFLTNCLMQEYSIIAQLLDTQPPFCNKSDIISYMRQQNYIEHTAREIVTNNNVYQLV